MRLIRNILLSLLITCLAKQTHYFDFACDVNLKLTCFTHTQLSGNSDPPLKVMQFHFTAWPDHGVPEHPTLILAFHRRVKSHYDSSRGPLLVHCRYKALQMQMLKACNHSGVCAVHIYV